MKQPDYKGLDYEGGGPGWTPNTYHRAQGWWSYVFIVTILAGWLALLMWLSSANCG